MVEEKRSFKKLAIFFRVSRRGRRGGGPYMRYFTVIKNFSIREGWWYIGIKGDGGVKSKGTRFLIEKEKLNRPILTSTFI